MDSIGYLDAIRKKHDCSDYRAAALIGVGKGQISAIRTGKSGFGEAPALRIAELLGLKPQAVLANLMAEKAPNNEVRGVWLEVVKKFSACVVLSVMLWGSEPVQAVSLHNKNISTISVATTATPATFTVYKYAALTNKLIFASFFVS